MKNILIYQSQDGRIRLDVRFEGETVWLTQPMMAELFETTVPNIACTSAMFSREEN
jgi:hypothetical protein